ncbi:cilia- and flagella-associated protein 100 isoform X2 [Spea bombifrons]|uniref:cilia- and flagella-associated protein 100 isoform X2 n=1 Tax=Spea bombifrons TaxID=233779 RepID=UPI00234BA91A|nr:cilia- and flagella-associated protein 100 isoform X2 [Spea bombifrons]
MWTSSSLEIRKKRKKRWYKELNKNLKVHQKTTHATQMHAKLAGLRKEIEDEEKEVNGEDAEKAVAIRENPSWKLAVTGDTQIQKESLHEFINKKREMFLLEYSLTVKRDEIQKLEALAAAEEMKLEKAEQFLEEDAVRFDEFLKQNDRNSVEALKQADKETKLKMNRVAQIKSQTALMMNIKSDISKCEEILQEYLMYKEFLFRLSPKEWRDEAMRKKAERKKARIAASRETQDLESNVSLSPVPVKKPESKYSGHVVQSRDSTRDVRQPSRHSVKTTGTKKTSIATLVAEEDNYENLVSSDSDEEPELYFTDPRQLLQIFSELEEQNLSLIQNSQETEESLEEIKQTITSTEEKMEKETQQLKDHIDQLKAAIAQEEERASELELKSRVFAFGQYNSEDQEKMLASLSKKVEEVYTACIGENRANLSALQMLMIIEHQLEELLDNIEVIPKERIEVAEKAKEKERRLRLREEKIKQQKLHQEERLRRALERAQADPKKTTGRKLMARSDPPATKLKVDKDQDTIDKEKEEALLFFS